MSNRAYHHGQLRQHLLAEGRALLEVVGPEALSLRELAERCGVSKMAPYRHFSDRAALLTALAEEGWKELLARLRECSSLPLSPVERLSRMGVAYVRFAAGSPGRYRLMFSLPPPEPAATSPEPQAARSDPGAGEEQHGAESCPPGMQLSGAAYAELGKGIQAAQLSGWKQDFPTAMLQLTLWSLVHGLADLILRGIVPLDPQQFERGLAPWSVLFRE